MKHHILLEFPNNFLNQIIKAADLVVGVMIVGVSLTRWTGDSGGLWVEREMMDEGG